MTSPPETRLSLLVRLRAPGDREAWGEFVEIYRPVVYRLARYKGMQHADAEDVTQQVLISITRAIDRWRDEPERAQFRTWLQRVAHNAIVNALTRRRPDAGAGDTHTNDALLQAPASDGPDSRVIRLEMRRELFHWAAEQIQQEFKPDTWQAFWLTTVEGIEIEEAAAQLNRTRGAVYAARCRVMARLKEVVKDFAQE